MSRPCTAPASCMVCDADMGQRPADRRGLLETPICSSACRRVWEATVHSRVDDMLGGAA